MCNPIPENFNNLNEIPKTEKEEKGEVSLNNRDNYNNLNNIIDEPIIAENNITTPVFNTQDSIETGYFSRCKHCQRLYGKQEDAALCAAICLKLNPLNKLIFQKNIERIKTTRRNLVSLFNNFKKANGYTVMPFSFDDHPIGIIINFDKEANITENPVEELTWEHIGDLLAMGCISNVREGMVMSLHFIDTFIEAFQIFFGGQKLPNKNNLNYFNELLKEQLTPDSELDKPFDSLNSVAKNLNKELSMDMIKAKLQAAGFKQQTSNVTEKEMEDRKQRLLNNLTPELEEVINPEAAKEIFSDNGFTSIKVDIPEDVTPAAKNAFEIINGNKFTPET